MAPSGASAGEQPVFFGWVRALVGKGRYAPTGEGGTVKRTIEELRIQGQRAVRLGYAEVFARFERKIGAPAFLLWAIASRETEMGARSIGGRIDETFWIRNAGDNGFGHGILQVDKRFHPIPPDWMMNLEWQVGKGAEILADFFRRFGSWPDAVKAYNAGSPRRHDELGRDYGPDVMERHAFFVREFSHAPTQPEEEEIEKMVLIWHKKGLYLLAGGRRSPSGLEGHTCDALKAAGVKVGGNPDDDQSKLFEQLPTFQ